ncbi:diaminopropionate ammonia-lyase [Arthrobacter sp. Soc17.1.1.1]|uniref:diaminopropionate ammonia-lyase n=1 Tax=Arthrobacter sp. Soc17.1.1.1 TaxID=3121277 RepID=UPI002FE4E2EA
MTVTVRPWSFTRRPEPWVFADEPTPASEFHRSMPGYAPSPLIPVPTLAERWGVASVWVKDESDRLGLPAFKVLGASWAVNRAISATAGKPPARTLQELQTLAADNRTTLITATDGNHGRALAYMARLLDLPARIYVPGGLPESTAEAIRGEGATVIDTGVIYDNAVALAAAETTGRELLIQDTAWQGYEETPAWIIDGYSTLFAEIDQQLPEPATTVAVPTGVGSLLQAALQHYRAADRLIRPSVLAVEPATAACVTASLAASRPVSVDTSAPTSMTGLNCGTVSATAWPPIHASLDAAIGVTDSEAQQALEFLHQEGIPVGPCGAASLAGLTAAWAAPEGAEILGLGPDACVVLLSTEGAAANEGRR